MNTQSVTIEHIESHSRPKVTQKFTKAKQAIKLDKHDFSWISTLFATAAGAGILFLPINAGMYGIWPLILIALITYPMTFLSHRALSHVVIHAPGTSKCLNDIISRHFSTKFTKSFGFLYFLATFPILLIYSLGLINTLDSLLISQFKLEISRWYLTTIVMSFIFMVILSNELWIKKVIQCLTLPLSAILLILSVYLIPHWNLSMLYFVPTKTDFIRIIWLTIPMIVFAFNFSPAISSFAHVYRDKHDKHTSLHVTNRILKGASLLLFVFIMFFVVSCTLSLSPLDMHIAKQQNVSVLTYMATAFHDPVLGVINPIIAIIAMLGAFFGTYFGCRESIRGLIKENIVDYDHNHPPTEKKVNYAVNLFLFVCTFTIAIANTSILNIISVFCGPLIASMLFLFPMYAIYTLPELKELRHNKKINAFLTVIGLITLSAVFYSIYIIF